MWNNEIKWNPPVFCKRTYMLIKYINIVFIIIFFFSSASFPKVTIKGQLLDHTGKSNTSARVVYFDGLVGYPQKIIQPDKNGNFQFEVESSKEVFFIQFTMPDHRPIKIPIRNKENKNLVLDIKLSTFNYFASYDDLKVIGNFNQFNRNTAIKLNKEFKGNYSVEIKSALRRIKYQILNLIPSLLPVNGTNSEGFEYDNLNHFMSIVSVKNGKAKIIFDPNKLIVSGNKTSIQVSGDNFDQEIIPEYVNYYDTWCDQMSRINGKLFKNNLIRNFESNYSQYALSLLEKIKNGRDNQIQDILKLIYVGIYEFHDIEIYDEELRKDFYQGVIPSSIAWYYVPRVFNYNKMINRTEEFLNSCNSDNIRFQILFYRLGEALNHTDYKNYNKLYDELRNEYENSPDWEFVKNTYPTKIIIGLGLDLPDYFVKSIDDDSTYFSKNKMLGKIYLIDFWNTSCGPCIIEIPFLQKVYNKYKDKGFDILSINVGDKISTIKKFQTEKYSMPWENVAIALNSKILKDFGIVVFPTTILVNKNGIILEIQSELRNIVLEKTLAKYFK